MIAVVEPGRLTLEPVAREIAASHGLNPALVCALIERESQWNPFALRYEHGFYVRYLLDKERDQLLTATELRGRAFSWGCMQVMGQTAREVGFRGRYLAELVSPELGIEWGCKVLSLKIARAPMNSLPAALLAWNGGSNPAYPDEVQALMVHYDGAPPLGEVVKL